jgi:hypothetical protein
MAMMSSDSNSVSDGATIFLALATFVLAIFTAFMSKHAKSSAAAAARSADASEKLIEESKQDRAFAYRPFLTAEVVQSSSTNDGHHQTVIIENSGNGPAINCTYAANDDHGQWCQLNLSVVQGHSLSTPRDVLPARKEIPLDVVKPIDDPNSTTERLQHVILCFDVTGIQYRFSGGLAESCLPDVADKPAWATWTRGE